MKKMLLLTSLILLISSGCSRLDLAFNLANSFLINKTDDYFDLDREQTKWLRAALDKDISTLKKTILPQLVSEMFKAADIISTQNTLDPETVLRTYERLENLFFATFRVFTSTAVALVDRLTPEQITYFKKEFDKNASELKENFEKKSYEKIKKNFDSWVGATTAGQKEEIKNFVSKNPPPINETVYNRQSLAYAFIKVFPDKAARRKYVERLCNDYGSMRELRFVKAVEEKNKKVTVFVTSVISKMTSDQKKTLIETIRERANQLVKISKG